MKNLQLVLVALSLLGIATVAAADDTACGEGLTCCTGPYALCTSAPCTPIPNSGDNNQASPATETLCECVVSFGANVGASSCEARQQGDSFLLSTYSFQQTASFKAMRCPVSTPAAACLDAPCVVDQDDPSKAWCTCIYEKPGSATADWVTLGGDCDTRTCTSVVWSGATEVAIISASDALATYMDLATSPVRFCGGAPAAE